MDERIRLSVGEPDFPTPAHICEAARRAMDEGYTRYTPQPGFEDLRDAVAHKFQTENGIDARREQIVVSCGGKHSLYNVMRCAVGAGDEVILLQPYWFAAVEQVRLAGAAPVLVDCPATNDFQPDVDAIGLAISDATRAIVINSPCNPTGAVFCRQTLWAIARIAIEHDLLVITDEVYESMVFDDAEHVSIASLDAEVASRTVTINSVSKTHAMTGWRIGYAAMPARLAEKVTHLQSVSTSGPCAVAQRAALAAITGDQSHVETMVRSYAERREMMLRHLRRVTPVRFAEPQGTFYVFVDITGLYGRVIGGQMINSADDLARVAREMSALEILPATTFGAPHHVRLSFAVAHADIERGFERLGRLLA